MDTFLVKSGKNTFVLQRKKIRVLQGWIEWECVSRSVFGSVGARACHTHVCAVCIHRVRISARVSHFCIPLFGVCEYGSCKYSLANIHTC